MTSLAAALTLGLLSAPPPVSSPAQAAATAVDAAAAVDAEIGRLVAQKKYLSAATSITSRPERMASPRLLRTATQVLVRYYAMTINFGIFALKDLGPGERIEEVRGQPGTYEFVGGDWEKVLFEALAAHPDDPEVAFAIGEYLSRGAACGCGTPRLFTGESGEEHPYFERAHRAGLRDAWSLFRMGLHHVSKEPPDPRTAVRFFDEALALAPDDVDTNYDKAAALMMLGDAQGALPHARKALGRYRNASLDADTFHLYARAQLTLGNAAGAEKDFARALELLPQHAGAFTGLMDLLRVGKKNAEYQRRVLAFVALDFSNTWPLGVWVEHVGKVGILDVDREIAKRLAAREYAGPREEGSVFYNLGRFAELSDDRAGAHRLYRRSLAALKRQETPPEGALEALTKLVELTSGP